jgi:hypothetical protein
VKRKRHDIHERRVDIKGFMGKLFIRPLFGCNKERGNEKDVVEKVD